MSDRFCPHCGEKRVEPGDHTLRRAAEHLLEAFTHADGKFFLTLRLLLTRPGRLTADYARGRRKPYIPPLQLFLICNLLFFLLHPLLGSNTLTTDLNTHLHYSWHQALAESFVAPRLASRGVSVEAYAAVFDPAAVTLAKTLVILIVPVFSLAVMAAYWPHRRHYAAHLVFSLHFAAFWLLLVGLTLALTNLAVRLLRYADIFPSALTVTRTAVAFTLAIMLVYLFRAARVAFDREAAWVTAAKVAGLGLALGLAVQAYRCVLFFITFWTT